MKKLKLKITKTKMQTKSKTAKNQKPTFKKLKQMKPQKTL
jgi:hypothetical protein